MTARLTDGELAHIGQVLEYSEKSKLPMDYLRAGADAQLRKAEQYAEHSHELEYEEGRQVGILVGRREVLERVIELLEELRGKSNPYH